VSERLSLSDATAIAVRAFVASRVREADAVMAADVLTLAEAMGIATHGLSRVRGYVDRISAGGIDPLAQIAVTSPAPALRCVDGANGLGPAVAETARRVAAQAAKSCGIGATFVAGGNHMGALAPYLYLSADEGFASIVMTTTAPMMAPAGGREARIGNNPLGLAIPDPDGRHALLDIALSIASRSRVRAAAKAGHAIPESWATDSEGVPTTDPAQAMSGLMRAIGGDKGANLALCLDLMVSVLSGTATLSQITTTTKDPGAAQNIGHLFVLVDAAALATQNERRARMRTVAEIISATPAADPGAPPRVPGARALASLAHARQNGLTLKPGLLEDLRKLAGV
jgi:LDH2 family malate/lactate/ureidoglycolate dehydrogenase